MKSKKTITKDDGLNTDFFEMTNRNYEFQKEKKITDRENMIDNILGATLFFGVGLCALVAMFF